MNGRVFGKNRVHRRAQLANAFAMNNAQFVNSPRAAKLNVIQHHRLHVPGRECMQVQHAIDRQLNRLWIFLAHEGLRNSIRETPEGYSDECLITPLPALWYTYTHKEVIDNIAFSDQEPFSSESGSWLLGPVVFNARRVKASPARFFAA